ncbi:MAG: mechanosensitive ion channel family protein [Lactobacillus sp.]|nr:mechanosensitive ion channel family protein [Lactobacillus sp.]MCI1330563.1 mechanosensitive ion channel family protein [Lactobacillus sp.]MCI1467218.1 mechanosensitive ion channel family protein [Lactobacillus sp.]MCI1527973.1 mechanosensitive ion channel family protein [Lactobacillus sp.]MCI1883902.1 mechanosensitive ion channel family protein [Lactobacillus sp.]
MKTITTKTTNLKTIPLDWNEILHNLLSNLWQLLITSLLFWLLWLIGKKLITKYFLNSRHTKKMSQRTQTISRLASNIFQYTMLLFYLYAVLSILGVPIGTLLASAGIFSLALGLGAQGFVSDLVNGFFILNEDQYNVGDQVQIGDQRGQVVELGLRTTRIKSSDGSITFIPNRQITVVKNLSRGGAGIDIDLQLPLTADLVQVDTLIKKVNEASPLSKNLKRAPQILGVITQSNTALTFRIHLQAETDKAVSVKNYYWAHYLQALKTAGIIS